MLISPWSPSWTERHKAAARIQCFPLQKSPGWSVGHHWASREEGIGPGACARESRLPYFRQPEHVLCQTAWVNHFHVNNLPWTLSNNPTQFWAWNSVEPKYKIQIFRPPVLQCLLPGKVGGVFPSHFPTKQASLLFQLTLAAEGLAKQLKLSTRILIKS